MLNYIISIIWIINGLFCKILNLVPRHEMIVSRILDHQHARVLTLLIGLSEVLMAVWILSRFRTRLNAIMQIFIIATMNILELILVPDLLLWGKFNSIFALLLILAIYYNEFQLNKKGMPTA